MITRKEHNIRHIDSNVQSQNTINSSIIKTIHANKTSLPARQITLCVHNLDLGSISYLPICHSSFQCS